MNTLYFNYALEVEKTASITQAADNLFMTQPTLSKAIKDLENSLGFTIFRRTSKGVVPTQKGREFLEHARKIVAQIEKMELSLQSRDSVNQVFSLSIPRASYISQAAAKFLCSFDNSREMELDILETSSLNVIEKVASGNFVLGIIRCHVEDEDYFLKNLAEKGLQYENLWQSHFVALMSQNHPLARQSKLTAEEFAPYIEVAFGDDHVPYVRVSSHSRATDTLNNKRILVYDRAMQFDLLRANSLAYMWTSPLPGQLLEQNNLVQRKIKNSCEFKDLLISRAGYRYSKLDRDFINELTLQRNEVAYTGSF